MDVDGQTRWFDCRAPSSRSGSASLPVFFFHGGGIDPETNSQGEPDGAVETIGYDWWEYGELHGYIVVTPHSSVETDRNMQWRLRGRGP
jgi:hypothetical protein